VSDVIVTCVELSVSSAKLSIGTNCLDRNVDNFSSSRKIRETVGARCRLATVSTLSDVAVGDDGGVVTIDGTRSAMSLQIFGRLPREKPDLRFTQRK
jgi:hypothetical protein